MCINSCIHKSFTASQSVFWVFWKLFFWSDLSTVLLRNCKPFLLFNLIKTKQIFPSFRCQLIPSLTHNSTIKDLQKSNSCRRFTGWGRKQNNYDKVLAHHKALLTGVWDQKLLTLKNKQRIPHTVYHFRSHFIDNVWILRPFTVEDVASNCCNVHLWEVQGCSSVLTGLLYFQIIMYVPSNILYEYFSCKRMSGITFNSISWIQW